MNFINFNPFIYSIVVTITFLMFYIFFNFKIRTSQKLRTKSINRRDIGDAVETDSPVDNQESEMKKMGVIGVEDRYSFIKKAFPLALSFLWFASLTIPYLGKIPTIYISIIAAVVSVLSGFALRPFLENLFSGVVISYFKSIRVGDTVTIDGEYGLIEEIGLTYSILKRWDWVRIIIPNSKLMQKEIQNLTMHDQFIWAHVEFFVCPKADIIKVEEISKKIAASCKHFLDSEDPSFWVMGMEKESLRCWLAAWAESPGDAWELRNEMNMKLTIAFQQEGINFHLHNLNSPAQKQF